MIESDDPALEASVARQLREIRAHYVAVEAALREVNGVTNCLHTYASPSSSSSSSSAAAAAAAAAGLAPELDPAGSSIWSTGPSIGPFIDLFVH